jgi:hypothetical protein
VVQDARLRSQELPQYPHHAIVGGMGRIDDEGLAAKGICRYRRSFHQRMARPHGEQMPVPVLVSR